MEQLHRINAYTCLLVGVPLNSALAWLIVRRSNDELRVYSRILLQTAVIDLLFLNIFALYIPVSRA